MLKVLLRRYPLRFHLCWILLLKLLALILLYVFLFGPSKRPHVDAPATLEKLLSFSSGKESPGSG